MELHDMSKGMCTMNVFELSQTLSRTNFPRQIIPKGRTLVFKREFADVGADRLGGIINSKIVARK